MPSLTSVAYTSRNLIKYGGIGLVVFVIMWTIIAGGIKAYRAVHPPYVPPTVKFSVLPKIVFPEKSFEKKGFTFQFPNDATPKFKDQAKVIVVYRSTTTFSALAEDTKTAADLGFSSQPTEVSTGIYQFKNDNFNQKLTMNVLDGSFKMEYPYKTDQMLLTLGTVPDKTAAIELAANYLKTGSKYDKDLENGEKKVSFWKISGDGLTAASAQSDANITRVDFYRQSIDDLQILSTEVNKASVSVLLSGSDSTNKKIVEVDYKHANIDRESFSTYPIKTADEAITELKAGNYWPASDVNTSDVVIRKMYLAYFEPVTLTNYMQPIFVFEGDNNFVAYVPAVTDKYTK